MAKLQVLHFPDSRLRQKASKVTVFDEKLTKFANDMLETMYFSKGIGLAAVQVNVAKRVIVIDVSENRDEPLFLVNPEIIDRQEPIKFEEGCLSVPGFYEKIDRFNVIEFEAQDLQGEIYKQKAEGLLAVCIQHEIDHLDGKLFVDYISNMKRDRIAKKIKDQFDPSFDRKSYLSFLRGLFRHKSLTYPPTTYESTPKSSDASDIFIKISSFNFFWIISLLTLILT